MMTVEQNKSQNKYEVIGFCSEPRKLERLAVAFRAVVDFVAHDRN
jgi:hypothetical protein